MWVKLDDAFWMNRKVRKAWRAYPQAIGLHAMALSWSAREEENGFVAPEFVDLNFASTRDRDRAIRALLDAGLWKPFGDGWEIHDFLEYNPSAEKVAAMREARRLAGRAGGQASARRGAQANGGAHR